MVALLTLGFPVTPEVYSLVSSMHKLVGSFFNRHAVEVINYLADSL